jgi:hypothetical protein
MPTPSFHSLLSAGILLLVSSLALPNARASDDQARRDTFELARAYVHKEQWSQARDLLLPLFLERPTYDVALQLGQAEYQLGLYRAAAEHLALGLTQLPPREPPQTAQRSRQLLASCQEHVGTFKLVVKNKGAAILVDGVRVANAPLESDLFVAPGRHDFEVRLSGYRSERWSAQLLAGQTTSRSVTLQALGVPELAVDASDAGSKDASNSDPNVSSVPFFVGGILVVVGAATGVGANLLRHSRQRESSELRAGLGNSSCASPDAARANTCERLATLAAEYDAFGRLELVSFLISGAALVATGSYYWSMSSNQRQQQSLQIRANVAAHSTALDVSVRF